MRYTISFEVDLPDIEHTEEELSDYLRWSYGDKNEISTDNPFEKLNITAPEPIWGTFNYE